MSLDDNRTDEDERRAIEVMPPSPGVIVLWTHTGPTCRPIALNRKTLVVGREVQRGLSLPDRLMSREHLEISHDGRRWKVRDLGSRNGTYVDGARIDGPQLFDHARIVHAGHALLQLSPHLPSRELGDNLRDGDYVCGWQQQEAIRITRTAAAEPCNLLIRAETGAGKERLAHWFHEHGPHAKGPFVSVNCAAIPRGLAETHLFGVMKGAFTGADATKPGYFEQAHRGVLFLDEVGDLDADVQAKLLRVLETGTMRPVGGISDRTVSVLVVAATNRPLGPTTFRPELYNRLAHLVAVLPPLRERLEEIPFLITLGLERVGAQMTPSSLFIEQCLLRPWSGNVRMLLNSMRAAARNAEAARDLAKETGRTPVTEIGPEHLPPEPAEVEVDAIAEGKSERARADAESIDLGRGHACSLEELRAALARHGGNVVRAAEDLGVGKTKLYEVLKARGMG